MQIPSPNDSQPAVAAAPQSLPPQPSNPFAQKTIDSANPYNAPNPVGAPLKEPVTSNRIEPTAVEVGDVINYAWEVWKSNLGLLVGITVVVFAVNMGFSIVQEVTVAVLGQQGGDAIPAIIIGVMISFVSNLIQMFLGIGQSQIVLKLLRGQSADFGELFGGGSLFLRLLGAAILAGMVAMVGFILLIIPGIILVILFWPFYYLIIDRKAQAIESFSMAYPIGSKNVGTSIVLWLATVGISIVGILALCIGIFFATALISTMWGAAYLMMSGQISARR